MSKKCKCVRGGTGIPAIKVPCGNQVKVDCEVRGVPEYQLKVSNPPVPETPIQPGPPEPLPEAPPIITVIHRAPPPPVFINIEQCVQCDDGTVDLNHTNIPIDENGIVVTDGVVCATAGFFEGVTQEEADLAALAAAQEKFDSLVEANTIDCGIPIVTYFNRLQFNNPCGAGLIDQNNTSLPLITDCTPNENNLVLCGTYATGGIFYTAVGYFSSTVSQEAADALAATAANDRYVQWAIFEGAGDVDCGLAACSGPPDTSDMTGMTWAVGAFQGGLASSSGSGEDISYSGPRGIDYAIAGFGLPAVDYITAGVPGPGPWPSFCSDVPGILTLTYSLPPGGTGDTQWWINGEPAGSFSIPAQGTTQIIPVVEFQLYSISVGMAGPGFPGPAWSGSVHVTFTPS